MMGGAGCNGLLIKLSGGKSESEGSSIGGNTYSTDGGGFS